MCRGEGSCTVSKSLLRRSWSGRDFGRPYTMVHPYTAPGSLSRVRNRPVLPTSLSRRRHRCCARRKGICGAPYRAGVFERLQEGDQRIYRALHTPETCTIAALNSYLHRPRRTRANSPERVPLARKYELDQVASEKLTSRRGAE